MIPMIFACLVLVGMENETAEVRKSPVAERKNEGTEMKKGRIYYIQRIESYHRKNPDFDNLHQNKLPKTKKK